MRRHPVLVAAMLGMLAVAEHNERKGKKVLVLDEPEPQTVSSSGRALSDSQARADPEEVAGSTPVPSVPTTQGTDVSKNTGRNRKFSRMIGIAGPQNFTFADDAVQGVRQGERIARKKHDFSASERCIERIKARIKARNKPTTNEGEGNG